MQLETVTNILIADVNLTISFANSLTIELGLEMSKHTISKAKTFKRGPGERPPHIRYLIIFSNEVESIQE